ncbi:uncharacterized protein [Diadema setosum]|uniref:uncharacterized protein n=1 Tax=Diadema setosum TaxID=31175 RepID=UPI003B3A61F7
MDAISPTIGENGCPGKLDKPGVSREEQAVQTTSTSSASQEPMSTSGACSSGARPRAATDVTPLIARQRSPISSPSEEQQPQPGPSTRAKSHSLSNSSNDVLSDDFFNEDDNKTREREMWAMLAGQTAFKFQSYIFQRVLPKSLIKPHIFPRHVEDLEAVIEKYANTSKAARLDGAAEKWAALKSEWKWRKAHGLVLGAATSAYLHISNPLEVMMKLDREKGDSLEDARRAYRNVVPPNLQEAGQEIVDLMHMIGLLTDKSSPPSPR